MRINFKFYKMKKIILALCVVVSLAACKDGKKEPSVRPATAEGAAASGLSVAFVNTDSIFAKYDYVIDVMGELDKTEKKFTSDLQQRAANFKADYDNYLKVGATLTLSEQKKKEEQLQKTQASLGQLEQQYAQQLGTLRAQRTTEVQDKIFEFIEKYNEENIHADIVFSNARTSGVLSSSKDRDFTNEILDAMNKEYAKNKKK